MKLLFIHPNFPSQYHRFTNWLLKQGEHQLVVIQQENTKVQKVKNLKILFYAAPPGGLEPEEEARRNALQVEHACASLQSSGFIPDAILGHAGWGVLLNVKKVFPESVLIPYFEYFQPDLKFSHYFPSLSFDDAHESRIRKARGNIEKPLLEICDAGISPTRYQRDTYPAQYREKIHVLNEGIETNRLAPNPKALLKLEFKSQGNSTRPSLEFKAGSPVLTFVSRYLEPARGYDSFLKALPAIQKRFPDLQTVILGIPGHHYGPPLPLGSNGRPLLENDLRNELDMRRIHFLGHVSHDIFIRVMQISRCHIYWSIPLTLSWSLIESMVIGCRLVAADNPLIREVTEDGKNALLGKFNDFDDLANLAIQVLSDPQKFDAMSARARVSIVEKYDADRIICPQYFSLIKQCLQNKKT